MDAIDFVSDYYGIDDDDMFELFGTDATTQRRLLNEHPEWRGAVREMEGLISRR